MLAVDVGRPGLSQLVQGANASVQIHTVPFTSELKLQCLSSKPGGDEMIERVPKHSNLQVPLDSQHTRICQ